jgi:metal-responsive CopG/Arc/MetJ family transcriptional regulator
VTIQVQIPDDLAAALNRIAVSRGKSVEEVALSAIQRDVEPFTHLDEIMAPTYAAMNARDETEDDAVEFFETIKHEIRHERRVSGQ